MAAEQRKLLEQLMGEQALVGTTTSTKLEITDPKLCKSYLVGTCPHELFTNTKQDLGTCDHIHSEPHKIEYEAATDQQKERWAFDYEYYKHLQRYVEQCNRRIEEAQRRLDKTPDEIRQTNNLLKQIDDLSEDITLGLQEIEALAEQGAVNLAFTEFVKIRQYQATKADRERELKDLSDHGGPSGHQKLQVCDVCGAYLSRLDNDRRLADHFYGKMHLGYASMRKEYDKLKGSWLHRPPPVRDDQPPARQGHWERDGGDYGSKGGYGGDRYYDGGFRGRGGRGRGRGGFGGGFGRGGW